MCYTQDVALFFTYTLIHRHATRAGRKSAGFALGSKLHNTSCIFQCIDSTDAKTPSAGMYTLGGRGEGEYLSAYMELSAVHHPQPLRAGGLLDGSLPLAPRWRMRTDRILYVS